MPVVLRYVDEALDKKERCVKLIKIGSLERQYQHTQLSPAQGEPLPPPNS